MSAWDLYDELIDAIPLDIQVVKAAQGPQWTRIYTNNPSCGIALTMSASSRPAQMNHDYAGIPLRAIAQLSKSWNFAEASFGMAALNAFYSTQGVAYDNNFVPTPGEKVTWGEVFDATFPEFWWVLSRVGARHRTPHRFDEDLHLHRVWPAGGSRGQPVAHHVCGRTSGQTRWR